MDYTEKLKVLSYAEVSGKHSWDTGEVIGSFGIYRKFRKGFDSRLETRVAGWFDSHGVVWNRCSVEVPDLFNLDDTWFQTPDFIVFSGSDPACVVEVDFPRELGGGSYHNLDGWPAWDTYRTDCLLAAGFTVVRLRLGGLCDVEGALCIKGTGGLTKNLLRDLTTTVKHIAYTSE